MSCEMCVHILECSRTFQFQPRRTGTARLSGTPWLQLRIDAASLDGWDQCKRAIPPLSVERATKVTSRSRARIEAERIFHLQIECIDHGHADAAVRAVCRDVGERRASVSSLRT